MNSPLVQSPVPSQPRRRGFPVRRIWTGLAAGLLATLIVGVAVAAWPQAAAEEQPQLREFTLTASEFDWELQPGMTVRAWGYNGQMPGPEIRVKEGDRVRITLQNELPAATTIHWHGVMLPPEMDGPAGLNQAAVEPGETFVYDFIAKPAGSRMYHSHTDVVNQIALGLYGAFVVEPRDPETEYDVRKDLHARRVGQELTPDVATGKAPRGPRDSQLRGGELGNDLFLMNGHTHEGIDPINVEKDDKILIRLMNMGSLPHPIHLHGHLFKIVATDGNPVPEAAQLTKDTVLIGPGERYDIELVADNPGVWMVHCHIESHAANGMMTHLAYDGSLPTGPLKEVWEATNGQAPMEDPHAGHTGELGDTIEPQTDPAAETTPPPAEPTPEPTPTPAATEAAADPSAKTAEIVMVDDRFGPKSLTIEAGTTVTFVNNGGNIHTVGAADKSFSSEAIKPGGTYSVTFDTPGEYKYICRNHLLHGMTGVITVTAPGSEPQ